MKLLGYKATITKSTLSYKSTRKKYIKKAYKLDNHKAHIFIENSFRKKLKFSRNDHFKRFQIIKILLGFFDLPNLDPLGRIK